MTMLSCLNADAFGSRGVNVARLQHNGEGGITGAGQVIFLLMLSGAVVLYL